jgi:hypothetical protein
MGNFHNDLGALDGTFHDAQEPEGGGNDMPPDGNYQCVVEACDLSERTIKKGRDAGHTKLLFTWKLRVTEGDFDGFKFDHKQWLSNDPQKLGYIKRDFKRAGLPLTSLTQLDDPDFRATLLDRHVEVAVKTNGQYTNTYINGGSDPVNVATQPAPRAHGGYATTPEEAGMTRDVPIKNAAGEALPF